MNMKVLDRPYRKVREAENELASVVKRHCKPGLTATWGHGDYLRSGEIVESDGERVCILSQSGNNVWIDACRILDVN